MQLDQVRAIITGGASGLGHAVASMLASAGASVCLLDVNQDKGEAAAAGLGGKARFYRVDVTDEAGVASTVDTAAAAMGGLNVAINCAGVLGAGRVLGKDGPMPLSQFETTVRINLIGSFNVAKAAAARMQSNPPGEDGERGVIVHTASIAAYEGQIGQAAYSASKGGVVGMTLPMAREFARIGVRVMTVARASSIPRWSMACRRRSTTRCAPRCPTPPALARAKSSPTPSPSSCATAISTAASSASTAQCAWRPSDDVIGDS